MSVQQSIFDVIGADDQMFDVGDQVWRVTIDVIERYFVSGTFDCKDFKAGDGRLTMRYHLSKIWHEGDGVAERVDGQRFGIIGKYDVGVRYFKTLEEARVSAVANMNVWKVMRAEDLKPVETVGYSHEDDYGDLHASFAILPENMVYRQSWYSYAFAKQYPSAAVAKKAYAEAIEEALKLESINTGLKVNECDPVFRDVYSLDGKNWASPEYALNNFTPQKSATCLVNDGREQ